MSDELDELRAENAQLRAALAARGVSLRGTPDNYPTAAELDSLYRIVIGSYPTLGPERHCSDETAREYRDQFDRAFYGLSRVRRRDKVDLSRYPSFWCDHVNDLLRGQSPSQHGIGLRPFMAAVIAHGDIPHSHPAHRLNYAMALGLGVGDFGRPYAGAWRRTLDSGRVVEPVPIGNERSQRATDIAIIGGNNLVGRGPYTSW